MQLPPSHTSCLMKLVLGGWIVFIYGCYSPQTQYEWGWGTERITGTLLDEAGQPLSQKGFIIVRTYYSQFVQLQPGQTIYFPQARLFFPNENGQFTIPFDLKAVKIDLNFIVPNYVMQGVSFKRQIGVGNIVYQIRMQKTAGWQDHLFVTITPFLQQFILEPDFQMEPTHQLYLGEWLEQEKEKNTPSGGRSSEGLPRSPP